MFKLDNDFLISLGLGGLPVDEKNKLLQVIYERLEMNVGMRLAEKMTDQQLDEFEGFIDRNDEAGALRWLETNFPNYKQVVAEELEKLKVEVSQAAPQILAAAQQNAASQQPTGQQFATQPQQPSMPPSTEPFGGQPSAPQFQPQAPQAPDFSQQPGYQQPNPQFPPQPQQPTPFGPPAGQPPVDPSQQPPAGFPPTQTPPSNW